MDNKIKNVFYINLKHRIDRKIHIEQQLQKLKWDYTRFDAIIEQSNHTFKNRIGCAKSHSKLLQHALEKNMEYIIILEDDILFNNCDEFNSKIKNILTYNNNFDVLLFAGNCKSNKLTKISDHVAKIYKAQCTTGYMVKQHYYKTLLNNYNECIKQLVSTKSTTHCTPIDIYWKKIQKIHNWYIVIPLSVYQLTGYSDIQKKNVNYKNSMLTYYLS